MHKKYMTEFTITVKLDLEQDARNYRSAFNQNKHAILWQKQIANILDFDFKQLIGIPEVAAYPVMKEYLEKLWKNNAEVVATKLKEITEKTNLIKEDVFFRMEKLTNHPIYRKDFTILLSSLNRWEYKYETWSNRHYIKKTDTILFFIHELLHFQTIHYYKDSILKRLHDENKFEELKEALTFLLNTEFKDIIEKPDCWYIIHQELRKKLEDYRLSQPEEQRDFEKLVEYGCDILLKNNNEI